MLAQLSPLYVVLLPALLLGGALDWVGMHMPGTDAVYNGNSGTHALAFNVHGVLTWQMLAANALFLATLRLPRMGLYLVQPFGSNDVLWSLGYEFWYYMAFPVLVLLLGKSQSWKMRVLSCLGLLAWEWFVGLSVFLLGLTWGMGHRSISCLPSRRAGGVPVDLRLSWPWCFLERGLPRVSCWAQSHPILYWVWL